MKVEINGKEIGMPANKIRFAVENSAKALGGYSAYKLVVTYTDIASELVKNPFSKIVVKVGGRVFAAAYGVLTAKIIGEMAEMAADYISEKIEFSAEVESDG